MGSRPASPIGVQRHSPWGETSRPGAPYSAPSPAGTNIDGPNGAISPAWQLMHWLEVTNSWDRSRPATTQSWVAGGRWRTAERSTGLIESKRPRNRGSAPRTGRAWRLRAGRIADASPAEARRRAMRRGSFRASRRHESSTRKRIGSPGKPAMFRSDAKVNSFAAPAGSAPGDWVAAWQRTQ